jgi:hypothetical protein
MRCVVFLDIRLIYLWLLNIGKRPVSGTSEIDSNRFALRIQARTLASWLAHNLLYAAESASEVGKPTTRLRHSSAALILVFGVIATVVLMIARTSRAAGSTPTAITLRSIATGSTSTENDHVTVRVPPRGAACRYHAGSSRGPGWCGPNADACGTKGSRSRFNL